MYCVDENLKDWDLVEKSKKIITKVLERADRVDENLKYQYLLKQATKNWNVSIVSMKTWKIEILFRQAAKKMAAEHLHWNWKKLCRKEAITLQYLVVVLTALKRADS